MLKVFKLGSDQTRLLFPNAAVTHYISYMYFSVVTSEKDGDYDPVAQFYWNLTNGFAQNPKEINDKENSQNNLNLVNNINIFISKFEAAIGTNLFENDEEVQEWIWEDGNDERLFEVLNLHWNPILIRCAQYTQDSADVLCELLDFLKKYSEVLSLIDFSDYISELIDIFSESQCPRNVVWHLINMFEYHETWGGVCEDQHTPWLLLSIGQNPIIGDKAYLAHLQAMWKEYKYVPSTFYDAFKNPSVTIISLSEIPELIFGFDVEFFVDPLQYKWDLQKIAGYPNYHFALVVARVFDEIKLGRVSWEDLITNKNKYFRTIAFYNPKTNVADKSRLLKTDLEEIDSNMLEFLSYSFANPYISALSKDLAGKPLVS